MEALIDNACSALRHQLDILSNDKAVLLRELQQNMNNYTAHTNNLQEMRLLDVIRARAGLYYEFLRRIMTFFQLHMMMTDIVADEEKMAQELLSRSEIQLELSVLKSTLEQQRIV